MRAAVSSKDHDDLIRLIGVLQAIKSSETHKLAICRELREKLQRHLDESWMAPRLARPDRPA